MRIKTPPRNRKDKERPKGGQKKGTEHPGFDGFTGPVPLRKPEATKYSMRKRNRLAEEKRKEQERAMTGQMDEREKKQWSRTPYPRGAPRPKRSMKIASRYEASQHTFWIRDDIYAAIMQFKLDHDRSLRSIVEEALYTFLIKEQRVLPLDDKGEDPTISSWVPPEGNK